MCKPDLMNRTVKRGKVNIELNNPTFFYVEDFYLQLFDCICP